jgi:tetratricopeptide (TPR) repeat protein
VQAGPVPVTPLLNTLIGAASDPQPIVRAAAARALGALEEPRTVPALAARLVDAVRTVRVTAVEALLQLGVVRLPGSAGLALGQAQEEYVVSLRTFGDMAGDHLALGWFEMQRGRDADATGALTRALTLAPADVQPRVWLGIIAARQGRFEDALREWRQVRAQRPAYPNIDRLIEEAERRRRDRPGGR